MSIRDRIARLERAVRPPAPLLPLVVECRRVGDDGETRPAGVYYGGGPGSVSPTVVFDGNEPDEALLARFRPARGPGPLVITCGPSTIPPPP